VVGLRADPTHRIRDLLTKPAGKGAESYLTEPTGIRVSLTNVDPLGFPLWETLSQGATYPSENQSNRI